MQKWISYGAICVLISAAGILLLLSPDLLSKIIIAIMCLMTVLSIVFGIYPVIRYCSAFTQATRNIERAKSMHQTMPWNAVIKMDDFFGMNVLDTLFDDYKQKAEVERKNGMIIGGIDDLINESELGVRSWQGVMLQVPGAYTGLGLLGTFIGLITGIAGVQISSVEATLSSIQTLFEGIRVAFFTSIAGVILSIIFNMIYKTLWNVMVRNYSMFLASFQRNVIPSVDEQERYSKKRDMQIIREKLDVLPGRGEIGLPGHHAVVSGAMSESGMMQQILAGIQNKDFVFYLQPRYDLNTHEIVGAEALVRWKHEKMGIVSPPIYISVLESNGYITKLDQYTWESVCITLRKWLDEGIHPVPISVNISKTDILALNMTDVFESLVQKYQIPPRYIELDIALNAYLEARDIVMETEKSARQKGFRVVVDGFKGDFFALQSSNVTPHADAYKLDLRFMPGDMTISQISEQARTLQIPLVAEGIENMKQMSDLRKNGIVEGQGFYLSKSRPVQDFEKLMNWSKTNE